MHAFTPSQSLIINYLLQILTDRFANPKSNSECMNLKKYCGGTFKGIIDKLDYIQGLGANAIWISPMPETCMVATMVTGPRILQK